MRDALNLIPNHPQLEDDLGSASPPALLSNLTVSVWDLPPIGVTLVNPASVSPPPCYPSSCLFLIFSTDFPGSFPPWSSSLYCAEKSQRKKNSICTQIYDYDMIISRACSFFLAACVMERYWVCVCPPDLFVKSWWHSVHQQCICVWMRKNYTARVRYYLWKWTIVFVLLCK